jgi:acetyl esterase/lipase
MARTIGLSLVLLSLHFLSVAQRKVIPLYAGAIPNSKKIPAGYVEELNSSGFVTKVSVPTLTVFFPPGEIANGTSVIIAPSGGYEVWVDEGDPVAMAFNKVGVTAFVLKYRLPSDEIMLDKTIGPLQDAQMAVLTLREHAAEWKIDPNKIGFVGISAGGHIASTAATHHQTPVLENSSNISLRPDFLILLYPVISMDRALVSKTQTRKNLLGETPTGEQVIFFSAEKNVTSGTPPSWIIHAADDQRITVRHSLLFYDALLDAGVKAEIHILQSGGHGFALEHPTRQDKWMEWCADWLRENEFID